MELVQSRQHGAQAHGGRHGGFPVRPEPPEAQKEQPGQDKENAHVGRLADQKGQELEGVPVGPKQGTQLSHQVDGAVDDTSAQLARFLPGLGGEGEDHGIPRRRREEGPDSGFPGTVHLGIGHMPFLQKAGPPKFSGGPADFVSPERRELTSAQQST